MIPPSNFTGTTQDTLVPLQDLERDLKRQLAAMARTQGGAKEKIRKTEAIIQSNNTKIDACDTSLAVASLELLQVGVFLTI